MAKLAKQYEECNHPVYWEVEGGDWDECYPIDGVSIWIDEYLSDFEEFRDILYRKEFEDIVRDLWDETVALCDDPVDVCELMDECKYRGLI